MEKAISNLDRSIGSYGEIHHSENFSLRNVMCDTNGVTDKRHRKLTHLIECDLITSVGLFHFLITNFVTLHEHLFALITLVAVQGELKAILAEILPLFGFQVTSTEPFSDVLLLFF